MPGPPRKPKAMAELDGNPGKRPYNDIPEPRKGAPKPPHWLKDEALAEWGRIVPELEAIGMLSVVDRAALTAYVSAWATFVEATKDIEQRGVVVPSARDDDGMVKNPSVQMQRDALAQIKTWCIEFGLTPAARGKIALPSEAAPDSDAEIANLFAI